MGRVAALAVVVLLAWLAGAGPAPLSAHRSDRAAGAAAGSRIAYVRLYVRLDSAGGVTPGEADLVLVNADGTGRRVLVRRVFADPRPTTAAVWNAWSPDGGRVAFTMNGRIQVVRPDGSGRRPVSRRKDGYDDASPAWSPDGRRIAFDHIGDGSRDLYVVDVDGRRERKLTASGYSTFSAGLYGGTGWSPDGREIVFTRGRVLARTRPDGRAWRRVGRVHAEAIVGASWSPDGREIAFGTGGGIWIVRGDGSGLMRLSQRGGSPVWSPDGSMLAFDHNGRVFVVRRDGNGLRQVGRVGIGAAWSPDGERLAYTSFRDGHGEIYVTQVDGGGEVRLTTTRAGRSACCASWSPR